MGLEERLLIADLRLAGTGVNAIAAEIGRSASTVSRANALSTGIVDHGRKPIPGGTITIIEVEALGSRGRRRD